MSRHDLEKIDTEVNPQSDQLDLDSNVTNNTTEFKTQHAKETMEEAKENQNSEFYSEKEEKQLVEEIAPEGDKSSTEQLQPTAESSLNHNDTEHLHNVSDSQNETTNITVDEDKMIETQKTQEENQEITVQNENVESTESELNGESKEPEVKTSETVSATESSTKTQQDAVVQQKVNEPYDPPVLDERQQELVKNMLPEDREKYLRTMSMIQKSKNETQKVH